tara:strand:+ start:1116 stop:1667 length:552 start_codon:yes stop_codon:yes gene_type:complete
MKGKFIKVYDDLFSSDFTDYIERIMLLKCCVPFYHVDNVAGKHHKKFPSPGFSTSFHSGSDYQNTTLKYPFFKILYTLSNKVDFLIEEVLEGRGFIHLPSPNPGMDGIHTDLNFEHSVCLYYVNDSDGDTVLFEDDKKTELKRVTPKKGRVVFFNGLIPHCSSRPAINSRAVINFDFIHNFYE